MMNVFLAQTFVEVPSPTTSLNISQLSWIEISKFQGQQFIVLFLFEPKRLYEVFTIQARFKKFLSTKEPNRKLEREEEMIKESYA
jgi:hypothetical protein